MHRKSLKLTEWPTLSLSFWVSRSRWIRKKTNSKSSTFSTPLPFSTKKPAPSNKYSGIQTRWKGRYREVRRPWSTAGLVTGSRTTLLRILAARSPIRRYSSGQRCPSMRYPLPSTPMLHKTHPYTYLKLSQVSQDKWTFNLAQDSTRISHSRCWVFLRDHTKVRAVSRYWITYCPRQVMPHLQDPTSTKGAKASSKGRYTKSSTWTKRGPRTKLTKKCLSSMRFLKEKCQRLRCCLHGQWVYRRMRTHTKASRPSTSTRKKSSTPNLRWTQLQRSRSLNINRRKTAWKRVMKAV